MKANALKPRRKPSKPNPKAPRSVWSGIKRKSGVSPLQLHLPGMGGVIS